MILFPSGTSPPLSRVSRCPWKDAQYMWSGEAMDQRCHTFKNQIRNILTLKSTRLRLFFARLPYSKILLSINKVSFTVNFIPIFLPTGSLVDAWCAWHSHYWPPTTAGGTHSSYWCWFGYFLLLSHYDICPQGPLFLYFCNNDSSRANIF